MSTSREVDNETKATVNCRFAARRSDRKFNDILRIQDNAIPNKTKKSLNVGTNVFRNKQCFNTQFEHIIGQNRWTNPGILDRDANINTRESEVSRQKYKGKRADLAVVARKVFEFCLSETFWNSYL